jgi:hypothetical protein
MLGNGCCARPVELDCHFESICESCTFFVTTVEFKPTLQRQRDDAAAKGQLGPSEGLRRATRSTRRARFLTAITRIMPGGLPLGSPVDVIDGGDGQLDGAEVVDGDRGSA